MPAERHDCYAICPPGVEGLTASELGALQITPGATEPGGVAFQATTFQLYAANLHLRTANRVIIRLAEFPARAFYELERKAKRVPWAQVVAPGTAVRFRVSSRKSKLYHLDAIAERLSNAAGGQRATGDGGGDQGGEERDGANAQLFVVRVYRDVVTVSADSSGELLHRRGYRQADGKAPLRETLAAAMLLGAGYDGSAPLVDPFAGSGTIPIEAALLARRIAPGLQRRFAFERWPSFDRSAWTAVRDEAVGRIRAPAPAPIHGSDRDAGAVDAARGNAERAGVAGDVWFREAAVSDLSAPDGPGFLVSNPPYGVRLGGTKDLRDLFARLGAVARARCRGSRLALLSADEALERQLGLELSVRWRSSNGGIPVRLVTGTIPA